MRCWCPDEGQREVGRGRRRRPARLTKADADRIQTLQRQGEEPTAIRQKEHQNAVPAASTISPRIGRILGYS